MPSKASYTLTLSLAETNTVAMALTRFAADLEDQLTTAARQGATLDAADDPRIGDLDNARRILAAL